MEKDQADLAVVLMEQSKFDEAEELFMQAQKRLLDHPAIPNYRKHELCENIVKLYEHMEQPERVGDWQRKLTEFQAE